MAMVHVTDGKNLIFISKGAYNEVYKKQGWRIAGSEEIEEHNDAINNTEIVNDTKDNEKVTEDETNNPVENEDEETTEGSKRELDEIPLKEMSLEELKEYANLKGIDITGLNEKKQIRKVIRDFFNN